MSFSVSETALRRLAATSAAVRLATFLVRLSVASLTRLSFCRSPDTSGWMIANATAAKAIAASSATPSCISSGLSMGLSERVAGAVEDLRGGERLGEPELLAVGVLAGDFVDDEVLQRDDLVLHAEHLGDVGHLARAVAQARGLDDDVDRADDHFANRAHGQRVAAHHDHRFETADRLARAVGVQ